VEALGAFSVVPQIGMIMLKPGSDAATVSALAPAVVLGDRRETAEHWADAFFAAADGGGSPLQVGVVLLIAGGRTWIISDCSVNSAPRQHAVAPAIFPMRCMLPIRFHLARHAGARILRRVFAQKFAQA
jgi:hypothetical protein